MPMEGRKVTCRFSLGALDVLAMGEPYKDEVMAIRKGPWMAEEDEILMDFVKKYGPRDWSSIRSKGLLPRTGKSCRLRWVNKLKPDLKTGCKFSAEEKKLVIDLQAQFGNRWARIATYLPGRTDNDVKNFWSTRQKRLARFFQAKPSYRPKKNYGNVPTFEEASTPSSSIQYQEEFSNGECSGPSSMGSSDVMKMVNLPDLVKPESLGLETDSPSLELNTNDDKQFQEIPSPFPFTYPFLDLPEFPESQGLIPEFSTTDFLDTFTGQDCLAPESGSLLFSPGQSTNQDNPTTPDRFFDDLPADMLNFVEPFRSSSNW